MPSPPDKRNWTRLAVTETATLSDLNGGSWLATIVDESFGGIGLSVGQFLSLRPGDRVCVMYYGAPTTGTVRRCMQREDGTCLVALEWLDETKAQGSARSS